MIIELSGQHHRPDGVRQSALRFFGAEVRVVREASGIDRYAVASRSHLSYAMIDKIENGQRFPRLEFAQLCDQMFARAEGRFERLWRYVAAWPSSPRASTYLALEGEADELSVYVPHVIPDLVQTPQYAEALLRPARLLNQADLISARMARQKILYREEPPQLWLILDERALYRNIGGPEVMRGQLHRLLDIAVNPRHRVQILTDGSNRDRYHPFTLLAFDAGADIVHAHGFPRGRTSAHPDDTTTARRAFDHLIGEARPLHESAELITTAMKRYL